MVVIQIGRGRFFDLTIVKWHKGRLLWPRVEYLTIPDGGGELEINCGRTSVFVGGQLVQFLVGGKGNRYGQNDKLEASNPPPDQSCTEV